MCKFICHPAKIDIIVTTIMELYINAYHKCYYPWCDKYFLFFSKFITHGEFIIHCALMVALCSLLHGSHSLHGSLLKHLNKYLDKHLKQKCLQKYLTVKSS